MMIQFNTDNNVSISEEYAAKLKDLLTKDLGRFSDTLTRIELHFKDENAGKEAKEDKKCTLEARIKGKQPIVVSANGNTYDDATIKATIKLKAALDKTIGKMKTH